MIFRRHQIKTKSRGFVPSAFLFLIFYNWITGVVLRVAAKTGRNDNQNPPLTQITSPPIFSQTRANDHTQNGEYRKQHHKYLWAKVDLTRFGCCCRIPNSVSMQ